MCAIALAMAFTSAWSGFGSDTPRLPLWVTTVCMAGSIPLMIVSMFIWASSHESDDAPVREIALPITGYFVAMGAGGLLSDRDDFTVVATIFLAGGLVALALVEFFVRRHERAEQLRHRVQRTGRSVEGRVTRARTYDLNYQAMTRVTVEFIDDEGRTRWVTLSVGGSVRSGDVVRVRYSQQDLGRRGAVTVTRWR